MFHLAVFLAEICVILAFTSLIGYVFKKVNQPRIVGEMTAGVLLGPSVLGWLWPKAMTVLFPPTSLDYLNVISQTGLLLYMFVVGIKLDVDTLKERKYTAILTSLGSIICPFSLGTLLAIYLHDKLSNNGVPIVTFALFMGTAMSITAFPVLARILDERNLLHTKIGTVAISCAAIDDITAWLLLTGITLSTSALNERSKLWSTVLGLVFYFGIMWFVVKPLLLKLQNRYRDKKYAQGRLTAILLLLLVSALATEGLGIHALFGAFFAGYIMPKDEHLVHEFTGKVETITVSLLLPIFFAINGLRTSITLVRGFAMWFYLALILVIAVSGKLFGSLICARLTGMSWREAGAVGVLMNTRGLIELVILNIGFELGVIPPTLFSMMVLMALITTFMTTPLLSLIYPSQLTNRNTVMVKPDN